VVADLDDVIALATTAKFLEKSTLAELDPPRVIELSG
jgi:hypothetical protein